MNKRKILLAILLILVLSTFVYAGVTYDELVSVSRIDDPSKWRDYVFKYHGETISGSGYVFYVEPSESSVLVKVVSDINSVNEPLPKIAALISVYNEPGDSFNTASGLKKGQKISFTGQFTGVASFGVMIGRGDSEKTGPVIVKLEE